MTVPAPMIRLDLCMLLSTPKICGRMQHQIEVTVTTIRAKVRALSHAPI
jgi:hypothetical protein